jgi:glucose/mannose-6-phosphate isomerase
MRALIKAFPQHLQEAIEIGEKINIAAPASPIQHVIITGLGGSGIGGTIVSQLTATEAKVPISVNKDYFLPAHVGKNTLVIISSYSGNTEETLSAMEDACKKGAQICCITTGGEVLKTARENNLNHIVIPAGMPPRAAFAYSFTQLFYVLHQFGIIGNGFKAALINAQALLGSKQAEIMELANATASKLQGKIPIIYSDASFEGVCVRFRQQLNENSKMLAWHHVFPELNHNELVGWRTKNNSLAVVIFRNDDDYARTQKRMEISKEVIQKYTNTVIEIEAKGSTQIEKAFYLIHLGDWVSLYLAELNGTDPIEIEVINYLKSELSKF